MVCGQNQDKYVNNTQKDSADMDRQLHPNIVDSRTLTPWRNHVSE